MTKANFYAGVANLALFTALLFDNGTFSWISLLCGAFSLAIYFYASLTAGNDWGEP